jgi:hypothetical protein
MLVIGYSLPVSGSWLLVSGLWLLIFRFGVRSLRLFEVRGKAFDCWRLEVGGNKEKEDKRLRR